MPTFAVIFESRIHQGSDFRQVVSQIGERWWQLTDYSWLVHTGLSLDQVTDFLSGSLDVPVHVAEVSCMSSSRASNAVLNAAFPSPAISSSS